MTLLLDAEARLVGVPAETGPEPGPARPGAAARQRAATASREFPAAPPAAAVSPAPTVSRGPASTPTPVASPVAPLPEPATWAGAGEQRRTLDDLLAASWEGLSVGSAVAACPVCDGELVRRWSAGAGVVGGRCRDCASELS